LTQQWQQAAHVLRMSATRRTLGQEKEIIQKLVIECGQGTAGIFWRLRGERVGWFEMVQPWSTRKKTKKANGTKVNHLQV